MEETNDSTPEQYEERAPLLLWQESVGKIFKLVTKSYGIRNVTYTKIKAVKVADTPGQFDVEVSCAEFTARVLNSKRAHSSGCKEGVIHQDEESILTPDSFGAECLQEEFEKVSEAILVHATMNLDLVMQRETEEENEVEVKVDLPHFKVTEMEASLLRNSPFLVKDIYLLSINSLKAGFDSINLELQRAARNTRLADTCDSIYVARKNETVTSLRNKLKSATPEISGQYHHTAPAPVPEPVPVSSPIVTAPPVEKPVAPVFEMRSDETVTPEPVAVVSTGRRLCATLTEKKNSIVLALRGKASPANLSWEKQNPSKQGAVFRLGKECGLLEFVRWAHLSGRPVSDQEVAGKNLPTYFSGHDGAYSGPDKEGFYPLFKMGSDKPERVAAVA